MAQFTIRAGFDFDLRLGADLAAQVEAGWTPKFIIGGAVSLILIGTVDGDELLFPILAAESVTLSAGEYWYQAISEENDPGVGRIFLTDGLIEVIGTITGSGVYDGRSLAEKILDAIDATILGKATKDQQSYVIQSGSGSRSLSRLNLAELMDARKLYAGMVVAERRTANGLPLFKRHKFAFKAD